MKFINSYLDLPVVAGSFVSSSTVNFTTNNVTITDDKGLFLADAFGICTLSGHPIQDEVENCAAKGRSITSSSLASFFSVGLMPISYVPGCGMNNTMYYNAIMSNGKFEYNPVEPVTEYDMCGLAPAPEVVVPERNEDGQFDRLCWFYEPYCNLKLETGDGCYGEATFRGIAENLADGGNFGGLEEILRSLWDNQVDIWGAEERFQQLFKRTEKKVLEDILATISDYQNPVSKGVHQAVCELIFTKFDIPSRCKVDIDGWITDSPLDVSCGNSTCFNNMKDLLNAVYGFNQNYTSNPVGAAAGLEAIKPSAMEEYVTKWMKKDYPFTNATVESWWKYWGGAWPTPAPTPATTPANTAAPSSNTLTFS